MKLISCEQLEIPINDYSIKNSSEYVEILKPII